MHSEDSSSGDAIFSQRIRRQWLKLIRRDKQRNSLPRETAERREGTLREMRGQTRLLIAIINKACSLIFNHKPISFLLQDVTNSAKPTVLLLTVFLQKLSRLPCESFMYSFDPLTTSSRLTLPMSSLALAERT